MGHNTSPQVKRKLANRQGSYHNTPLDKKQRSDTHSQLSSSLTLPVIRNTQSRLVRVLGNVPDTQPKPAKRLRMTNSQGKPKQQAKPRKRACPFGEGPTRSKVPPHSNKEIYMPSLLSRLPNLAAHNLEHPIPLEKRHLNLRSQLQKRI